jgi:type II secretory pathway component GspD/PulD (secretin)
MSRFLRVAAWALALTLVGHARAPEKSGPTQHDKRAAAKAYISGAHAIEERNTRAAYVAFSKAAELDPTNTDYKNAVAIAKAHFVTDLIQQAEKARILGKNDVVNARLAEALELDPTNPIVAQHISELADIVSEPPKTDDITSSIADAIQLEPTPGKHSFHIRADGLSLLRQVLSSYGIAPSFDSSVPSQPVRFDVDDVTFQQAQQLLRLQTNTFFVPLDPHRVLIAKDTRANRQEYERLLLETVYLPGLNTQEITDVSNLARNVLEIQQVAAEPSKNTLSVRGPETRLALFNRTLHGLMDGRSQVLLEVRIYEIQRTRNLNVGVQLPQQFNAFNLNTEIQNVLNNNQQLIQEIVSSGLANANDLEAIAAILIASGQVAGNSILTQPFAVFGGGLTATGLTLGTITVNAGLNTSDSRAIDQLQLRLQDQETGGILAGIRYPIIQSSYSNLTGVGVNIPGLNTPGLSSQLAALGINGSSLNAQTIPQVQYQDLGLQMKTTPYIHRDQSVSLKLDLKVQALAGSSINQIPILTNRQFTAALDLKDGESALVTSDLSSQEARAVSGLPGLSEIPGLQSTTNKEVQRTNNELVILITPHVVRLPHASGASQVMLLPTHQ